LKHSKNFSSDKPAERLWISSLLVRTLGLQDEAARSKNEMLDFTDAKQIPINPIFDVFAASEYGIFAGNTADLFQPTTPITRAQMAAVLDRTYGQLLEENGTSTVKGMVTAVSINNDIKKGKITVETFNGELLTYQIRKNLLVQYHNRFMSSNPILFGNNIELNIDNNIVLESAIFEKASCTGDEAIKRIEEYLTKWNISPEMTEEEKRGFIFLLIKTRIHSICKQEGKVRTQKKTGRSRSLT
jgi:hypothetical protein